MIEFNHKKSLGQNFLIDKNVITNIVNSLDITKDDLIVEIGPGSGALTRELCKISNSVFSFEIDERLKKVLNEIENSHIIFCDFLDIDLKRFIKEKKYKRLLIVGNLPYYITTPIVKKIIDESNPDKIVIMVQKEVANRYMAKSHTKDYSSISVYLQYHFNIKKVLEVSKNSFFPAPKVDSTVIEFNKRTKEEVSDINLFNKIIRDAFKMKRKNLRNNLKSYDLSLIEKALKTSNKTLNSRAEELSIEDFINITDSLSREKNIS